MKKKKNLKSFVVFFKKLFKKPFKKSLKKLLAPVIVMGISVFMFISSEDEPKGYETKAKFNAVFSITKEGDIISLDFKNYDVYFFSDKVTIRKYRNLIIPEDITYEIHHREFHPRLGENVSEYICKDESRILIGEFKSEMDVFNKKTNEYFVYYFLDKNQKKIYKRFVDDGIVTFKMSKISNTIFFELILNDKFNIRRKLSIPQNIFNL